MNNYLPVANAVKWILKDVPQYTLCTKEISPLIVETALSLQPIAPAYHINRTSLGLMLPVYSMESHGASKKGTTIRRIDGSPEALVQELARFIPLERIRVVQPTGAVKIEGHWEEQVKQFLTLRGF